MKQLIYSFMLTSWDSPMQSVHFSGRLKHWDKGHFFWVGYQGQFSFNDWLRRSLGLCPSCWLTTWTMWSFPLAWCLCKVKSTRLCDALEKSPSRVDGIHKIWGEHSDSDGGDSGKDQRQVRSDVQLLQMQKHELLSSYSRQTKIPQFRVPTSLFERNQKSMTHRNATDDNESVFVTKSSGVHALSNQIVSFQTQMLLSTETQHHALSVNQCIANCWNGRNMMIHVITESNGEPKMQTQKD
jgi:hypothetical protein